MKKIVTFTLACLMAVSAFAAAPADRQDQENIIGRVQVFHVDEEGNPAESVGVAEVTGEFASLGQSEAVLYEVALSIVEEAKEAHPTGSTCGTGASHNRVQYVAYYDIQMTNGYCNTFYRPLYVCSYCKDSYKGDTYNQSSHKTGSSSCIYG